jgi:tRNA pseudouridine55 synthase
MAGKDPAMGGSRLNGILVIDKPVDISSAGVVAIVKRTLQVKKVGHAGTLDPFAEGVLVCCVNRATRLARFLLHGPKKYVAVLKLGEETDTQDATGTVISRSRPADCTPDTLKKVMQSFEGSGKQLPPVYSALKHKGVALYKLARRGQPVQKPARRIQIYRMTIRKIDLPFVHFEVWCSAGTYIRTLCADIGKILGCGGHLSALKRITSSGFDIEQAIALADLPAVAQSRKLSERMISMADALPDMPAVTADTSLVTKIRHGRPVFFNDLAGARDAGDSPLTGGKIKIVDYRGQLVAILSRSQANDRLDYNCVFAD